MFRKTSALSLTKPGFSLSVLALLITGAVLYAGPLDPPAGPVTSTYKTLTEVEPRIAINATNTPGDADSLFKITQPGSYYLTGNITGVSGKHGIEIVASGVTLDLNGFDLVGATGSFDGVTTTVVNLTNLAVINGSVRDWGADGLDLRSFSPHGSRIDGVRASGNLAAGMRAGFGSTLTGCSGSDNGTDGITASTGSTLTNCAAYSNGAIGIFTSSGCALASCSATSNTTNGISVGSNCTVQNCSGYLNTATGIVASSGCTITNCSVTDNTGNGISTGGFCTVTSCTANSNSSIGISVGNGCSVIDCTSVSNTQDGIFCVSSCVIRGNNCVTNGNTGTGSGINATTSDNRIEGNTCTGADRGISVGVLGSGNIIIRNPCSGNTIDWEISANNVVGPILDRRAPASAAISGFSAPDSTGSTHPNANFTY